MVVVKQISLTLNIPIMALRETEVEDKMNYRHTLEIQWVYFQRTIIKWVLEQSESNEFFCFPVYVRVMFTLHCGLFSVQ